MNSGVANLAVASKSMPIEIFGLECLEELVGTKKCLADEIPPSLGIAKMFGC